MQISSEDIFGKKGHFFGCVCGFSFYLKVRNGLFVSHFNGWGGAAEMRDICKSPQKDTVAVQGVCVFLCLLTYLKVINLLFIFINWNNTEENIYDRLVNFSLQYFGDKHL